MQVVGPLICLKPLQFLAFRRIEIEIGREDHQYIHIAWREFFCYIAPVDVNPDRDSSDEIIEDREISV